MRNKLSSVPWFKCFEALIAATVVVIAAMQVGLFFDWKFLEGVVATKVLMCLGFGMWAYMAHFFWVEFHCGVRGQPHVLLVGATLFTGIACFSFLGIHVLSIRAAVLLVNMAIWVAGAIFVVVLVSEDFGIRLLSKSMDEPEA